MARRVGADVATVEATGDAGLVARGSRAAVTLLPLTDASVAADTRSHCCRVHQLALETVDALLTGCWEAITLFFSRDDAVSADDRL